MKLESEKLNNSLKCFQENRAVGLQSLRFQSSTRATKSLINCCPTSAQTPKPEAAIPSPLIPPARTDRCERIERLRKSISRLSTVRWTIARPSIGIQNDSTEITDLNSGTWFTLAHQPLKDTLTATRAALKKRSAQKTASRCSRCKSLL